MLLPGLGLRDAHFQYSHVFMYLYLSFRTWSSNDEYWLMGVIVLSNIYILFCQLKTMSLLFYISIATDISQSFLMIIIICWFVNSLRTKPWFCPRTLLVAMKHNKDFSDRISLLLKGRETKSKVHLLRSELLCWSVVPARPNLTAYIQEKQNVRCCSNRLTDAILFCSKSTWSNFFTERP